MPSLDTINGVNAAKAGQRASGFLPKLQGASADRYIESNNLTLEDQTAVIGKIPGYNRNIDKSGEFAKQLLKGITFIDLLPMSYAIIPQIKSITVDSLFKNIAEIIKQPALFQQDPNAMQNIFSGVLERMQKSFNLSPSFSKASMIRIIAANDSTFTETLSNDFSGTNSIVSGAKNYLNNELGESNTLIKFSKLATKGLKGLGYSDMISIIGDFASGVQNMGSKNAFNELITGALFGMTLAAPKEWQASQYTSTLTMFVKLVSPVGSPECIKKNILEPLLYLLAASSPITAGGSMYGFPLLWEVRAHGITTFRVGAIAAMTLTRGSFETTFNYLMQPTVIDVRLTIVPLLNDFAVQTKSGMSSIYDDASAPYLGVQNPADIKRGVTNAYDGATPEAIYSIKL